jgi:two-component system phosphate regulon response regulator PhoB
MLRVMSDRILVVDEDAASRALIGTYLAEAGRIVTEARDGATALEEIRVRVPALVILELALPGVSGLEICRRVRRDTDTETLPLVVVSARASEVDRVVAFEVGVDDFVPKPFSGRELALRVGAVLRRARPQPAEFVRRIAVGSLVVDTGRHRVAVGAREVALSPLERKLLTFLATNRDRVQSRETLLERVWGLEPDLETRTIDTHVKRLRSKLGEAGALIETLRGVGYRLREPTIAKR